MAPKLQVTSVVSESSSGADPRLDVVTVTMTLGRHMATRPIPEHMCHPEVFDAIGDWWDAQEAHQYGEEVAGV